MQINIPDEPFRRSGYTRDALLLDLAVMLYQKQVLDLAQATGLASRSSEEVADTIRERGIVLREAQIDLRARRQQLLQRLAHGWDRWQQIQAVDVAAWIREDRER